MIKKYTIYAYKHYWPRHLDPESPNYDPDTSDIPMPYTTDEREYVIEAHDEGEALGIAEKEYGSGEHVDKNFMVYSMMSWSFNGEKADCLNGADHNWSEWRTLWKGDKDSHFGEFYQRRYCEDCAKEVMEWHTKEKS